MTRRTWIFVTVGVMGLSLWAIWPAVRPNRIPPEVLRLQSRPEDGDHLGSPPNPVDASPPVPAAPDPTPIVDRAIDPSQVIRGWVVFESGDEVDRAVRLGAWPSASSADLGAPNAGESSARTPLTEVWAASDGSFVIPHLDPAQPYDVLAAGEGIQCSAARGITPGGSDVVIEAHALYGARLRFLGPAGAPITHPLPSRGTSIDHSSSTARGRAANIDPAGRALLGIEIADLPSIREAYAQPQSSGLPSVLYAASSAPHASLEGVRLHTGLAGFERVDAVVDLPRVSIPLRVIDIPVRPTSDPIGAIEFRFAGRWWPEEQRPHQLPQIWFMNHDKGDWFKYRVRDLGADGVTVGGLPFGAYQVELRPPQGRSFQWNEVVVGPVLESLEVDLAQRGSARVTVTTDSGEAYRGALRLNLTSGSRLAASLVFDRAPYHLLYQTPGAYTLEAVAGGGLSGRVEVVITPAVQAHALIQLERE